MLKFLFLTVYFLLVSSLGFYDFSVPQFRLPARKNNEDVRRIWEHLRSPRNQYIKPHIDNKVERNRPLKIGIIGGGIAGLFAGLLLNEIPNVTYTIFESEKGRVGGRLRTRYFSNLPHDYAELGGMRMPEIPEYQIVFDLIKYLNELNQNNETYHLNLTDFLLTNEKGLVFVNNAYGPNGAVMNYEYITKYPEAMKFPTLPSPPNIFEFLGDVMKPFLMALETNLTTGMELLNTTNQQSTHAFLLNYLLQRNYTLEQCFNILDIAEVLAFGTGILDTAFSEAVLDTFVFRAANWKTVDGGMQRLPNAFLPIISQNIIMGAKVQEIQMNDSNTVQVTWRTDLDVFSASFDHVITTLPFPVLYHIKIPPLSYAKRKIIRDIPYDSSCKIALRFQKRFWEHGDNPILGGTSVTDLPVRTIVYPSFGIGESGPAAILASYTFGTDAIRWGGMNRTQAILEALDNVATLHGHEIKSLFLEGDILCWDEVPTSLGAYTWLMPGEFSFFKEAGRSEGRLHFAGEQASPYHGWISGSLDSVKNSLDQIFAMEKMTVKPIGNLYP